MGAQSARWEEASDACAPNRNVSLVFLERLQGKGGHARVLQGEKTLARCPPLASWKSFGLYIGGLGLRTVVSGGRPQGERGSQLRASCLGDPLPPESVTMVVLGLVAHGGEEGWGALGWVCRAGWGLG